MRISVLLIALVMTACTTTAKMERLVVPPSLAMVEPKPVPKVQASDGKGVRLSDLADSYLTLKKMYLEVSERHKLLIKWVQEFKGK